MSPRRSFKRTLLDVEAMAKRVGTTKELVPVDTTRCPSCGAELEIEAVGQPALFFHGGYGAMQRTSTVHCHDCGWSLTIAIDEINPRDRADPRPPEPDWFSEEQNADLPPRPRRATATVTDGKGRV